MSKKDKKAKKSSAKKEKYLKYKKEKSTILNLNMPDLNDIQVRQKRDDEMKIDKYLKFNRNPPAKEIKEKKLKYK